MIRGSSFGRGSGEAVEFLEPIDLDPVRLHLNRIDREGDRLQRLEGGSQPGHFEQVVLNDEIEVGLVAAGLLSDQRLAAGHDPRREARVDLLRTRLKALDPICIWAPPEGQTGDGRNVSPSLAQVSKSALLLPALAALALTVMKSSQFCRSGSFRAGLGSVWAALAPARPRFMTMAPTKATMFLMETPSPYSLESHAARGAGRARTPRLSRREQPIDLRQARSIERRRDDRHVKFAPRLPVDGRRRNADGRRAKRSPRLIETIDSADRLAPIAAYTYVCRQQGFRSKNLLQFVSLNSG